jgi:hypothetical protein
MTGEQVWADYARLSLSPILLGVVIMILGRLVRAAVVRWFYD